MHNHEKPLVIAIDGPAASGKSTLAKRLAERLGFFYFDTGVMYRAATLAAMTDLGGVEDEAAVTNLTASIQIDVQPPTVQDGRVMDVLMNGEDVTWEIRTPKVDQNVSPLSTYRGVRKILTERQRDIGMRGNMVMVGRDIGTVVFPDARYKIYLEASPEERARRRLKEMLQRGESHTFEEVLQSILRRDRIDSTRIHAPLKPAADAVIIDTDGKTIEEVLEETLAIVKP